jgi:hypothetical protein
MYGKPAMTCFKYQVYLYDSETVTYLQRWAFPIEFQYSEIPIAIGLSTNYQNIGLTYLSDFKYRSSNVGLLIVRWLSDLLKLIGPNLEI